eukprot:1183702-Prorocentrum_minimum.AAC.2
MVAARFNRRSRCDALRSVRPGAAPLAVGSAVPGAAAGGGVRPCLLAQHGEGAAAAGNTRGGVDACGGGEHVRRVPPVSHGAAGRALLRVVAPVRGPHRRAGAHEPVQSHQSQEGRQYIPSIRTNQKR